MKLFSEQEIRSRLGISTLAIKFEGSERLGEQHFSLLRSLGISKLEISEGCDVNNKKEA